MSPSFINGYTAREADSNMSEQSDLSILGIGVQYPPYRHGPEALEALANKYYKPCPALTKVLSINRFTGIETRASIGYLDHPLVNEPTAPSIEKLDACFREEGVKLSVSACNKAIDEWGGSPSQITHMVSTTCTNSANPGFDHFVRKQLGVPRNVESVLLHGTGCSGGLAAIRTASNLALGASYQGRPARILVLACEISTLLVRSELDSIVQNDEVRIGVCLFSDCASACIVSNNVSSPSLHAVEDTSEPIFDILGTKHDIIPDTEDDLGFDVDPLGWKVVLTPRVPKLASAAVAPAFNDLLRHSSTHNHKHQPTFTGTDFDWALHPGGSTIITGVQAAMGLQEEHLMASFDVYVRYGNSSSATVMSVMDRLREMDAERAAASERDASDEPTGAGAKRDVVACAFGPGISLEMMLLRRRQTYSRKVPRNVDEDSGHALNGDGLNGHVNGHTNGTPDTADGPDEMNGLKRRRANSPIDGRDETKRLKEEKEEEVLLSAELD